MRLGLAKRSIAYLQERVEQLSDLLRRLDRSNTANPSDLPPPVAEIDVDLAFPIEFFIEAVPLSLQASARSQETWWQQVENVARSAIPAGSWATQSPVLVTIYYFPNGQMTGDIDNIVKPILDALSPMIYLDDSQVDRVIVQKFESGRVFRITNPTPRLAKVLETEPPVVYIRVDDEASSDA